MKLISNDCLAGFLYKELNKEFNHPFFWNLIHIDDFAYLIKNFNNIDFTNILLGGDLHNSKFYINVDDKFIINKNHYKFSPMDKTPRKCNYDIYYCKIWEYIIDEYNKRVVRMKNDENIFILHYDELSPDFKDPNFIEKIYDIINYCISNKIKIIYISNIKINIENEFLLKLCFNKRNEFKKYPADIPKRYLAQIKKFIQQ